MTFASVAPWLSGILVGAAVSFGLLVWFKSAPAPERVRLVRIVKGDITLETSDVIVNAAKSSLLGGGGVDGAIHKAAGPELLDACRRIRETVLPDGLPTGKAIVTGAGRLPARYVIHTVGPVYHASENRAALLRSCYSESLKLAAELGAKTISFPLISSGVYGWPIADAVEQFRLALASTPADIEEIRLVLFDDQTFAIATGVLQAAVTR